MRYILRNGKEKDLLPKAAQKKFNKIDLVGYSQVRNIYVADYARTDSTAAKDNRMTLYWNPNLHVDSVTHIASLDFYNNNSAKRFRVVVEGMDSSGKIVYLNKIITQ